MSFYAIYIGLKSWGYFFMNRTKIAINSLISSKFSCMYIFVYKIAGDSSKIYSVFYEVYMRNTYFCVLFLKFTVQSSSHLTNNGW
jgi:hypothetical protein